MGNSAGTIRNAALDGWRGIAILMVVFDHVQMEILHRNVAWLPYGQHGVTAFFVLSGFLITGKLLESGASLARFYLRRAFRLMPVAWFFLIAVWAGGFCRGSSHFPIPAEIVACLLFVRNYFNNIGVVTAHYWSLSIEEQFYFVWPLLLLTVGAGRAKWIALWGALGSYGWYLAHRSFYDQAIFMSRSEVRADALLIGCFAALVFRDEGARKTFSRWARVAFWPCIVYLGWESTHVIPVPSLFECSIWCLVITYSAFDAPRWLSFAPLVWLGRISYSVYVWNMLAIGVWVSLPLMFRWAALAIPVASYYLIERPGTEAGRKLTAQGASSLRSFSRLHRIFKRERFLGDAPTVSEAGGE